MITHDLTYLLLRALPLDSSVNKHPLDQERERELEGREGGNIPGRLRARALPSEVHAEVIVELPVMRLEEIL
jgi:hypothetical protein